MNKKNKDILKLTGLLRKLTAAVFYMGIKYLNKPAGKIFLRNICKIDPSLYIFRSGFNSNITVGFKTFYCGVDTYIPPELKCCWISDHHFLSVFIRTGINSFNVIPYNHELYGVKFRRISFPPNIDPRENRSFFNGLPLIDEITSWINLFYFNDDENILYEQGISFPQFERIDRDKISDMIKLYQFSSGIKHVQEARRKMASDLEKILSSFL